MEWITLFGSILSNTTEVHSLELGVQFAVLTIFVMRYSSRELGATFFSIITVSVFFISPIEVISEKPWYFLSGVLLVFSAFELHLYLYTESNIQYFTKQIRAIHPRQVINRFR